MRSFKHGKLALSILSFFYPCPSKKTREKECARLLTPKPRLIPEGAEDVENRKEEPLKRRRPFRMLHIVVIHF
jgi:hypothetical protein